MQVAEKVQFQLRAKRQGDQFEEVCITALKMAGFEIADRKFVVPDVGIEIDIIAHNREGIAMAFECTGSWNVVTPGMERNDTLKKKLCNAWLLSLSPIAVSSWPPLIILTSHLPIAAGGRAHLSRVPMSALMDIVRPEETKRLAWWATRTDDQILVYLREHELVAPTLRYDAIQRRTNFEFYPPMK